MPVVVDPRFPARLRELRAERGLSLRRLAARVPVAYPYLSQLEHGTRNPSPETAGRLDDALGAGGELADMVTEVDDQAEAGRVRHAIDHPRRVDAATVDTLADTLAALRRLDDTLGAAAVLPAADRHRTLVATLTREAPESLRERLVGLVGQWCQFQGWLSLSTGRPGRAGALFGRALAAAGEVDDRELRATALSFQGHAAYLAGATGPMLELTRASLSDPAVHVGQLAYDHHQLARALAVTGDQRGARDAMAAAIDLSAQAAAYTGPRPPWHYYRTAAFWALEGGVTLWWLGERQRAADRVREGLSGLPLEWQSADWTGQYRAILTS